MARVSWHHNSYVLLSVKKKMPESAESAWLELLLGALMCYKLKQLHGKVMLFIWPKIFAEGTIFGFSFQRSLGIKKNCLSR